MSLLTPLGLAAAGFGSTGALLMAETWSPRPLAMHGAMTALVDDSSAIYINPAGLAASQGLRLDGGLALGLLDTRVTWGTLGWNLGVQGALGLQAAVLSDTDTRRDAFGNELGEFNNSVISTGLAWARNLSADWRVGLGAKGLSEDYAGSQSLSVAGDLGLQGRLSHGVRVGLSAQNMGAQLSSNNGGAGKDPTPWRVQAGVAVPLFFESWQLEVDAQHLPIEEQLRVLIGTELTRTVAWGPSEASAQNSAPARISLRLGTALGTLREELPRLTAGLGLATGKGLALDYALLSLGPLGLLHRMSIGLEFSAARPSVPSSTELSAPTDLRIEATGDQLRLSWQDSNGDVAGYNLYSDFGILAERMNSKPMQGQSQLLINAVKGQLYNFYVRPIGGDGKEGPASRVLRWVQP